MLKVLITAYTGFSCARKESERLVPEHSKTIIHTGFWGCGAFGGNRQLMTILQCFAADLAKVDLKFWAVNDSGAKDALKYYEWYQSMTEPRAINKFTHVFLSRLATRKYQWGESDGN